MRSGKITIVDSVSEQIFEEKIWGESLLGLLYGGDRLFFPSALFRAFIAKCPFISWLWGKYNDREWTKRKIEPFCKLYQIDHSEFEKPLSAYRSFNDFFIRRLKPSTRPIDQNKESCIAPADARYTFIPNLDLEMPFTVKGQKFDLISFFQSREEAIEYVGGTMVIARLCPIDCHRYVFPASGSFSSLPRKIEGDLYSVSPIATSQFPWIWWQNKRIHTKMRMAQGSTYSMIEVGATNCGTIVQTCDFTSFAQKGAEKGYFMLGGSAIILVFPKDILKIEPHLLDLQEKYGCEVYMKYGQKLGICAH